MSYILTRKGEKRNFLQLNTVIQFILIKHVYFLDNSSCGIGRQARMADCRRSDGKIVHPFFCRVEGRRIPMLLRMCTVPCPRNCELSEWGSWTPCPESCGVSATQIRTRFISASSKNGGQPCLQSEALQGKFSIFCWLMKINIVKIKVSSSTFYHIHSYCFVLQLHT